MDRARGKILLVEDDSATAMLCQKILQNAGFEIIALDTVKKVQQLEGVGQFSLIILDLTLPDGDGLLLLRRLHQAFSIPILIMSARNQPEDRVAGFASGAADYLVKPFHPNELLYRVRRLISEKVSDGEPFRERDFSFGPWAPCPLTNTIRHEDGRMLKLTSGEMVLLLVLVNARGRITDRETLVTELDASNSKSVDVLVSRLRKKIEMNPRAPEYVLTVTGRGYRLNMAKSVD